MCPHHALRAHAMHPHHAPRAHAICPPHCQAPSLTSSTSRRTPRDRSAVTVAIRFTACPLFVRVSMRACPSVRRRCSVRTVDRVALAVCGRGRRDGTLIHVVLVVHVLFRITLFTSSLMLYADALLYHSALNDVRSMTCHRLALVRSPRSFTIASLLYHRFATTTASSAPSSLRSARSSRRC